MDPFKMLTELCNALKSIGIKFKGVNESSKGKAIGIVYTDGQRDDLVAICTAHKDTMLEHKGEFWNIRHDPAGEMYNSTDAQGNVVQKPRQRDRFTLLTQVTYDDLDSALNA